MNKTKLKNMRRFKTRLSLVAKTLGLLLIALGPVKADQLPSALKSFEGRIVYVDFWASWCSPCRRAVPWLNAMQRKYGNSAFTIVGVNLDEDRNAANAFLGEHAVAYPVVFDPSGELARYFEIKGMPSTIILDTAGKELARHVGFFTDKTDHYEKTIQAVLAAQ